jgi:hypothetical protein
MFPGIWLDHAGKCVPPVADVSAAGTVIDKTTEERDMRQVLLRERIRPEELRRDTNRRLLSTGRCKERSDSCKYKEQSQEGQRRSGRATVWLRACSGMACPDSACSETKKKREMKAISKSGFSHSRLSSEWADMPHHGSLKILFVIFHFSLESASGADF